MKALLCLLVLTGGFSAWGKAQLDCGSLLRTQADPDGAPIQRRIKVITDGSTESAISEFNTDSPDPSLVMPVTYPDGKIRYRISFTGMHFIEADNAEAFFRGGIFKIQRARGFYPDGTEMVPLFDGAAWPWDVVIYTNADGQQIVFGGVMEQPAPGRLPSLAQNATRSRWWGEVRHVLNESGQYEEHIHWRAPLHDFNRTPRSSEWVGHGYGGTLLTRFNPAAGIHEPVRLASGNYLLYYERVTEEKQDENGGRLPWVTSMFAREVNPQLTDAVGPEYQVTNLISPVSQDFYKATRRGEAGETGYLAEGGNVLMDIESERLIKAFSANDFVRRYGIYLDYLPAGADPRSEFTPVTDDQGELIDFADELNLREIIRGTWVGRPQLEYAPDGKLWLRFHYVPTDLLPPGAPLEGWPPHEFIGSYPRYAAQIPVRIVNDSRGQPHLAWDLD